MPSPDPTRAYSYDGQMAREGDEGVIMAAELLRTFPGVVKVTSVESDPVWQKKDVDLLVETATNLVVPIEAKSDRWASGKNFLFELARIHHSAVPHRCAYLGWSVFTEAERVTFWCKPTNEIFLVKTGDFRLGFQQYALQARPNINVVQIATDSERTTIGILIPKSYVPHVCYRRAAPCDWAVYNRNGS